MLQHRFRILGHGGGLRLRGFCRQGRCLHFLPKRVFDVQRIRNFSFGRVGLVRFRRVRFADRLKLRRVSLCLTAQGFRQLCRLRIACPIGEDHRAVATGLRGLALHPFHIQPSRHQRVRQGRHGLTALTEGQRMGNISFL